MQLLVGITNLFHTHSLLTLPIRNCPSLEGYPIKSNNLFLAIFQKKFINYLMLGKINLRKKYPFSDRFEQGL